MKLATPIAIVGPVIKGNGQGKGLGFPTLNLPFESAPASVEPGIYAGFAAIDGIDRPAAVHVGTRPTLGSTPSVEVHLIDEAPPDHVAEVILRLTHFLRPVKKFASVTHLQVALAEDVRQARECLLG